MVNKYNTINIHLNNHQYNNPEFFLNLMKIQDSEVILIVMPFMSQIESSLKTCDHANIIDYVQTLAGTYYPSQVREIIQNLTTTLKKIIFITPEVFLYWFNSESNTNIKTKTVEHIKYITKHISHIILYDLQIACPAYHTYKDKYNKTLEILNRKYKDINLVGICTEYSNNIHQDITDKLLVNNTEEEIILHHDFLEEQSQNLCKIHYSMSDKNQKKDLIKILQSGKNQATIIILKTAQNNKQNTEVSDLITLLDKHKILARSITNNFSTELTIKALKEFINTEYPIFITDQELDSLPIAEYIERIIYIGLPASINSLSADLYHSQKIQNIHVLVHDKDIYTYVENHKTNQLIYQRDGLQVHLSSKLKQWLRLIIPKKICKQKIFLTTLFDNIDMASLKDCGTCSACHNKSESFMKLIAMKFMQMKFKKFIT